MAVQCAAEDTVEWTRNSGTIDYVTGTHELSRNTTNRLDQIAYAHRR